MSFALEHNLSRLPYDVCSYEQQIKRSEYPGMYMLDTPANDCRSCSRGIIPDPFIRQQKIGFGNCASGSAIDDSSELLGLNYSTAKCETQQYTPGKYPMKAKCSLDEFQDPRSCDLQKPVESTRLSHPACTLRGTGVNRYDFFPCNENPQDFLALPEFDYLISSRKISKDNHVPCLEKPEDQERHMPPSTTFDPTWSPNAYTASLNTPFNNYDYGRGCSVK
tara:strand:+ start:3255 stop:3917 length:663 start_codon:yes stop_codon:yes gene_type:complete